jgi:hypothetical protein
MFEARCGIILWRCGEGKVRLRLVAGLACGPRVLGLRLSCELFVHAVKPRYFRGKDAIQVLFQANRKLIDSWACFRLVNFA